MVRIPKYYDSKYDDQEDFNPDCGSTLKTSAEAACHPAVSLSSSPFSSPPYKYRVKNVNAYWVQINFVYYISVTLKKNVLP